MERLNFISSTYLEKYSELQPITLVKHFNKIKKLNFNNENFQFYLSHSAVYSSMIEGNKIDFDSYLSYSSSGMNNKGKSFKEIEDLKKAYSFAKDNKLNLKNLLIAHKYLTKTIIEDKKYQGKIRDKNVFVYADAVKIYTGPSKETVNAEMDKFFTDIAVLLKRELTITQVFYYAAMLHLILVQIHPFADGNGRCSRLIEKWFLAQKLGDNAWFIQSEKLYQQRLKSYYKNVHLGDDYLTIDYKFSMPFLLMLPMALRLK